MTTVNKHSHEMIWFWNRIVTWSSLHEPVLIYGSSHGSVFELPAYRVHNEYNSKSPVTEFGFHEWSETPRNMFYIKRLELTLECPCVTAVFRHVRIPSFPFSLYLLVDELGITPDMDLVVTHIESSLHSSIQRSVLSGIVGTSPQSFTNSRNLDYPDENS